MIVKIYSKWPQTMGPTEEWSNSIQTGEAHHSSHHRQLHITQPWLWKVGWWKEAPPLVLYHFHFVGPNQFEKKLKRTHLFPKWMWLFSSFTHPTKSTHSLPFFNKKEKPMSVWLSVNHFQHFNNIIVPIFIIISSFYNPEEERSPLGPMLAN